VQGRLRAPGGKWYLAHAVVSSVAARREVAITNVPLTLDTLAWVDLLRDLGASAAYIAASRTLTLDCTKVSNSNPDPAIAARLRASIELLAPLFTRFSAFSLGIPGGDRIGKRPIEGQIGIVRAFGASVVSDGAALKVTRTGSGAPSVIRLPRAQISVAIMATVMATSMAQTIRIENVPVEPEIAYHVAFMNLLGYAVHYRRGTSPASSSIIVDADRTDCARDKVTYALPTDPTWVVTFAAAAASTDGCLIVDDVNLEDLGASVDALAALGTEITAVADGGAAKGSFEFKRSALRRADIDLTADYFPAISTDHLPFLTVLAAVAGPDRVRCHDRIFEWRDNHFDGLRMLGASICAQDRSRQFEVRGPTALRGSTGLRAPDIRGGMALLIASLCAQGRSEVECISHIYRGYEDPVGTLQALGADVALQ
jgi:UDP-N-acetylglucosamine 1-carboxyvinyltransferase